jgi:hypothetical protein
VQIRSDNWGADNDDDTMDRGLLRFLALGKHRAFDVRALERNIRPGQGSRNMDDVPETATPLASAGAGSRSARTFHLATFRSYVKYQFVTGTSARNSCARHYPCLLGHALPELRRHHHQPRPDLPHRDFGRSGIYIVHTGFICRVVRGGFREPPAILQPRVGPSSRGETATYSEGSSLCLLLNE